MMTTKSKPARKVEMKPAAREGSLRKFSAIGGTQARLATSPSGTAPSGSCKRTMRRTSGATLWSQITAMTVLAVMATGP
jgi:hypothetical protein